LYGRSVIRHRRSDFGYFADQMLCECWQKQRPVRRHDVIVGWRNWRRQRDLEFYPRRNYTGFLQLFEEGPGCDRHLGITCLECFGIGLGAGFDAQALDLRISLPSH
jgi:hypothetical protein